MLQKYSRYINRLIINPVLFLFAELTLNQSSVWIVGVLSLLPQVLGSFFKIWYCFTYIRPALSQSQQFTLTTTVVAYNLVVDGFGVLLWLAEVQSLHRVVASLKRGKHISARRLTQARKKLLRLPWFGATIMAGGWIVCIPVFLGVLFLIARNLELYIFLYFFTSISISGLIAVTQSFFLIEFTSQQQFYPSLFRNAAVTNSKVYPMSLYKRGFLVMISVGICPIAAMFILLNIPQTDSWQNIWLALTVGLSGTAFGLISAWVLGRSVVEPVMALKEASQAVMAGDFSQRIDIKRADEFGHIIEDFNRMVAGLEEKQYLRDIFGCHVGQGVAKQILQSNPNLLGRKQNLTVMFVDIRDFTARSAIADPSDTVLLLNRFLIVMLDIVEKRHGGMVNQLLGDGFMALFGVGPTGNNHAAQAVNAAIDMMRGLEELNKALVIEGIEPLRIGIGIHTGIAIAGSIGSPKRMEYTAVGNTVNVAARIEELTKHLGTSIILSHTTKSKLPRTLASQLKALPPQIVKGKTEAIAIYTLNGMQTEQTAMSTE